MASNFKTKANDGKGFFRQAKGEFGFNLSDSLLRSEAFRSLTPSGKVVLIDMLRIYFRVSAWESTDIVATGFQYAFSVCDATVSENTFDRARKEIVRRGFFETPPELQNFRRACSPSRFVPSNKWRDYKPISKEVMKSACAAAKREIRLQRTQENKRRAIDQLAGGRPKRKKQPAEMEDIDTAKMEDIQNGETSKTPRDTAKMEDIKPVLYRKNGGHLCIPYGVPPLLLTNAEHQRKTARAARRGRKGCSKAVLPLLGFLEPADPNLFWPERVFEEVAI